MLLEIPGTCLLEAHPGFQFWVLRFDVEWRHEYLAAQCLSRSESSTESYAVICQNPPAILTYNHSIAEADPELGAQTVDLRGNCESQRIVR